jgi:hypothetical protein
MATRPREGDPLWAIALGILLLLLLIGGGVTGVVYFAKDSFLNRTSPEAVDAAFNADPYAAPLLEAIRTAYPADYARIRETLSQSARRGTPPQAIQAETFALLRQASLAHLDELAQAPHAELSAFNAAETRLLEGLEADDVVLCGKYIMRGFAPGDDIPPRARGALSEMGTAQWRASAAGRDRPAARKVSAALSPRDSVALVAAMREQGMGDRDLQIFASPPLFARAEPWRQCALGKWLVAAVGQLPAEQSDRIAAWLIMQKRMN